jgi:hypothetical protein
MIASTHALDALQIARAPAHRANLGHTIADLDRRMFTDRQSSVTRRARSTAVSAYAGDVRMV